MQFEETKPIDLFDFKKFSSMSFMLSPKRLKIDNHLVEYLGFCHPENRHRPALIFLGGAFQNFFSFKKEVQVLMEEYPVILVDLPSQGSNEDLAPEFMFEDFAHLLAKFLKRGGITQCIPLGLSYGSATAFYFGSLYPEMTFKIILGGTTTKVRESYRLLLEDSIKLLDSGDMEIFAQGAVMNLINYSKRKQTQIPERVIKGFHKNMQKLSENDKLRFKQNTQRLLKLNGVTGKPEAETLVFTGEYDNFTTPQENYQMYSLIPNAEFLLIKDGDHLANLEKRDTIIALYQAFLKGEDLSHLDGIKYYDQHHSNELNRRLDERHRPVNLPITLSDHEGESFKTVISDINYYGAKVDAGIEELKHLRSLPFIHLEIEGKQDLDLSAHIFSEDDHTRLIFRRGNFEAGERLEQFILSLAD